VDYLNKKLLIVLGIFWLVLVPIAAAGSVAAEGLYWGDSVEPVDDEPVTTEPIATDPLPVFKQPVRFVLCGLYWGD